MEHFSAHARNQMFSVYTSPQRHSWNGDGLEQIKK